MKTAEEWHHTAPFIQAQRAANPNWKCNCLSCQHVRLIQSDARTNPLTWTNVRPIEPGWYWCRNDGDNPGEIWEAVVRLDRQASGGDLICSWMTAPGAAAIMMAANWSDKCLWAGPLTPPGESNAQNDLDRRIAAALRWFYSTTPSELPLRYEIHGRRQPQRGRPHRTDCQNRQPPRLGLHVQEAMTVLETYNG